MIWSQVPNSDYFCIIKGKSLYFIEESIPNPSKIATGQWAGFDDRLGGGVRTPPLQKVGGWSGGPPPPPRHIWRGLVIKPCQWGWRTRGIILPGRPAGHQVPGVNAGGLHLRLEEVKGTVLVGVGGGPLGEDQKHLMAPDSSSDLPNNPRSYMNLSGLGRNQWHTTAKPPDQRPKPKTWN